MLQHLASTQRMTALDRYLDAGGADCIATDEFEA